MARLSILASLALTELVHRQKLNSWERHIAMFGGVVGRSSPTVILDAMLPQGETLPLQF
nr:hypothetical protein [uncultured Halomonas sp.]